MHNKNKRIDTLEGNYRTLFAKTIIDGSNTLFIVRDIINVIIKAINDEYTIDLEAFINDNELYGDTKLPNDKGYDESGEYANAPNTGG